MNWEQAKVGCYYNSGPYHIASFQVIGPFDGSGRLRSGYSLSFNGKRLAETKTLQQAKDMAQRHSGAK